jgi:hypothetical protein
VTVSGDGRAVSRCLETAHLAGNWIIGSVVRLTDNAPKPTARGRMGRNAASCSGGSDASNSAGETFSDSDNFDLDRITVRRTGVFVGAGFAPVPFTL